MACIFLWPLGQTGPTSTTKSTGAEKVREQMRVAAETVVVSLKTSSTAAVMASIAL